MSDKNINFRIELIIDFFKLIHCLEIVQYFHKVVDKLLTLFKVSDK